jgi:hypothetical protein
VWRTNASESMSGRRPIGTCRDGDVEGGSPVGCGFDSDEHAATRANRIDKEREGFTRAKLFTT